MAKILLAILLTSLMGIVCAAQTATGETYYVYFSFSTPGNPTVPLDVETQKWIMARLNARANQKGNTVLVDMSDAEGNRKLATRYLAISPYAEILGFESFSHGNVEARKAQQVERRADEASWSVRQAGSDIQSAIEQQAYGHSTVLGGVASAVGSAVIRPKFEKKADEAELAGISMADQLRWDRNTYTVLIKVKIKDKKKDDPTDFVTKEFTATYYIDELFEGGRLKGLVFRRYDQPVGKGSPLSVTKIENNRGYDKIFEDFLSVQLPIVQKRGGR